MKLLDDVECIVSSNLYSSVVPKATCDVVSVSSVFLYRCKSISMLRDKVEGNILTRDTFQGMANWHSLIGQYFSIKANVGLKSLSSL